MIIQVGGAIGVLPTLAILILDGFVGAALAHAPKAGPRGRFNRVLAEGRVPARETADGAMIIFGGALLLTAWVHHGRRRAVAAPASASRALIRAAGSGGLARQRASFEWTVVPRPAAGAWPWAVGLPAVGRSTTRPGLRLRGQRARVTDPETRLPEAAMTEVVGVEFSAPGGERLRVEWPVEALENPSPDSRGWSLVGEIDWDGVEAVRISRRHSATDVR